MPRFSFIIPVYNVEHYLRKCLDTVFNQSFRDFEVCIVDDGSTDRSGQICDEYASRYGDEVVVRLIHQQNQGVSVARNKALDTASGEYIWFVDADDYIDHNALAFISKAIKESGCDTVFFGEKNPGDLSKIEYSTDERNKFLSNTICYCNPLMIFSRNIICSNKIRFTEGMRMGEDLEFQYKYLLHCTNPIQIPYNFYYITIREGSASRSDKAINNNYLGSRMLIYNLADYLKQFDLSDNEWITSRIEERLKSYLQSCAYLKTHSRKIINKEFHDILATLSSVDRRLSYGGSLTLARIDVGIYFFSYKLLKLLHDKL